MPRRYPWRYRRRTDPPFALLIDLLGLIAFLTFLGWLGVIRLPFLPSAATAPSSGPAALINTTSVLGWVMFIGILVLIGATGILVLYILAWFIRRRLSQQQAISAQRQTIVSDPPTAASASKPVTRNAMAGKATPAPPVTVQPPFVALPQSDSAVEAHSPMSDFERAFFWQLSRAVPEHYVFPQVPLRELVRQNGNRPLSHGLAGMFSKGVVDYVLADPVSLQAVLALEFDDPSHMQADAQARDRRKDEFLRQVGLPLVRVDSRAKWNSEQIRQQIQQSIVSDSRLRLLNDTERDVFRILIETWPDLFIFPRLALAQIIRVRSNGWLSPESYRVLKNATVDFVLAHSRYLGPLRVVEVDRATDSCKIELLEGAGIKLLQVHGSIESNELRAMIG